ncbi:MAG: desulfoferrodoxin FeS4 iron-binding domain-containing protein [Anaerolineaceae bacterium]|nr:desulfoferrodoxin FeS4 iron-binding domain-containing protein [Anaerolineaceae bacterium]
MAEKNEYYHCEICDMVVKVLQGGGGTLVCCGQDMTAISEEQAREMSQD